MQHHYTGALELVEKEGPRGTYTPHEPSRDTRKIDLPVGEDRLQRKGDPRARPRSTTGVTERRKVMYRQLLGWEEGQKLLQLDRNNIELCIFYLTNLTLCPPLLLFTAIPFLHSLCISLAPGINRLQGMCSASLYTNESRWESCSSSTPNRSFGITLCSWCAFPLPLWFPLNWTLPGLCLFLGIDGFIELKFCQILLLRYLFCRIPGQ